MIHACHYCIFHATLLRLIYKYIIDIIQEIDYRVYMSQCVPLLLSAEFLYNQHTNYAMGLHILKCLNIGMPKKH